jgi:hypothetical protein
VIHPSRPPLKEIVPFFPLTRYLWIVLAFFTAVFPGKVESQGIFRRKAPLVLPVNGHRGPVNVLLYDHGGRILSAGSDGFLGVWDVSAHAAVERFQLSPFPIVSMVLRPDKPEIALIEREEPGFYRVSAWNYETKQKLFVRSFKEPVSYINYSGGGNFLVAAQESRAGAFFINAETGDNIHTPLNVKGIITFAATGRSERTMIAYVSSGFLSYWELESGEEIRRLSVPSAILSPILLGNNNIFAGFDSNGLVILNALSGDIIVRDPAVSPGILVPEVSETLEFLCYSAGRAAYFSLTPKGSLEQTHWLAASVPGGITSAVSAGKIPVLGSADGKVRFFDQRRNIKAMDAAEQLTFQDAAVSGGVLAFIGETDIGFLPLNYTAIKNEGIIQLEGVRNYTHITPESERNYDEPGEFILWRSDGGMEYSLIKDIPIPTMERGPSGTTKRIDRASVTPAVTGESLLSVSLLTDQMLFLDTGGNITLNSLTEEKKYSFFSQGALDAVFLDNENIIISRSTGTGGPPFLMANLPSGETVPLDYPSSVGLRIYRGLTGSLYGGVVALVSGNAKTGIIKLDITRPDRSELLMEYQGEDISFDMAECNGAWASTLGQEGALIYKSGGMVPFERTSGLPVRLFGGTNCFLAIDKDGSITWHDPESGKTLALLRLYDKEWFLAKEDGSLLSGTIKKNN